MKNRTGLFILVSILVVTLTLAGCTGGGGTGGRTDKIVRIAQWNPPTGMFHPELLTTDYDGSVASLIYEQLVDFTPTFEYEPALAASWDISEDNRSVTFHLQPEATWHDGEPVTSKDVQFSLKFVGHKDYTGPRYSNVSQIVGMEAWHTGQADDVEGIEIIDEKTIKITTIAPYGPFLYSIGGRYVLPEHIWGNVEVAKADQQRELLEKPVGSGPFVFQEFAKDQYVATTANENYWGGKPKVDGIIIQAVSQDTAQAQLIKGEIDIMSVSDFNPTAIKALEDAKVQLKTAGLVAVQYMSINHEMPEFQDKRVRQALAHAINRQSIVDDLLYGRGNVADNPFPKTIWSYPGDDVIKHYEFDSAKAIQLFEAAGYTYANDVMTKDGQAVKWSLKYPIGNKVREKAAELIQQNLSDIGIEVELFLMEFQTLADAADTGDFEMLLMGMGTSFDADQLYIWDKGSSFNYSGWYSQEGIDMLKKGVSVVDIDDRKPIYKDWAVYMNEELPWVWLYNWDGGLAVTGDLKNVQFYAGGSYYNIVNWEFE